MLPPVDTAYLSGLGVEYEIVPESGMTCITLRQWPLPVGFNRDVSDLLLRLHPGYPDVAPDMWWFNPEVLTSEGHRLPQTEVTEHYLGRTWQRWSRHLDANQWKSGVDGLESYFALLRSDMEGSVSLSGR